MKKTLIVVIAIVAVVAAVSTVIALRGWPAGLVGSGNLETESYAFSDFTEVEIGSGFEFEIEQSSSYSIDVTADDNENRAKNSPRNISRSCVSNSEGFSDRASASGIDCVRRITRYCFRLQFH
jgi:hypothetical protein